MIKEGDNWTTLFIVQVHLFFNLTPLKRANVPESSKKLFIRIDYIQKTKGRQESRAVPPLKNPRPSFQTYTYSEDPFTRARRFAYWHDEKNRHGTYPKCLKKCVNKGNDIFSMLNNCISSRIKYHSSVTYSEFLISNSPSVKIKARIPLKNLCCIKHQFRPVLSLFFKAFSFFK